MEESVGKLWDRLITRAARRNHSAAAVRLEDVMRPAGMMFRAFGGAPGVRLVGAPLRTHTARRSWLSRIAGTDARAVFAACDTEVLRLPPAIDLFSHAELNRDLYIWLAALAAVCPPLTATTWFAANQRATCALIARLPGLQPRYRRLVDAALALRPDAVGLPATERAQERAVCQALRDPGSWQLPSGNHRVRPPQPVPLWLYPAPNVSAVAAASADVDTGAPETSTDGGRRRHAAKREEAPQKHGGLLLYRFESIFSWGEYIKLDRATEEADAADAARAAEDMEALSVTRDAQRSAAAVRLDMDLPPETADAQALVGEVLLPEWHYQRRVLEPDRCRVLLSDGAAAVPCALPERLKPLARRLRRQFEQLAPATIWMKGEPEGEEPDLDSYVQYEAARQQGPTGPRGLYRARRRRGRDLACLLLADLSLSTEAWVGGEQRVIDVIRDSLFLFSEALDASHDRFALYGFSSRRREAVNMQRLKAFDEAYTPTVRGRIAGILPGYYTRMGAAVRYCTQVLTQVPARERLLLLLTDGKPNDIDRYEGRFGIEDTRMALRAARTEGVNPFCVTIDNEAREYLPHLFGAGRYALIQRPAELPARLPQWYARLTHV